MIAIISTNGSNGNNGHTCCKRNSCDSNMKISRNNRNSHDIESTNINGDKHNNSKHDHINI